MDFSNALEEVKDGKKIRRTGWNGKGMFIIQNGGYKVEKCLVRKDSYLNTEFLELEGQEHLIINPHLDMWMSNKTLMIGWLPSQADIFGEDWEIVD